MASNNRARRLNVKDNASATYVDAQNIILANFPESEFSRVCFDILVTHFPQYSTEFAMPSSSIDEQLNLLKVARAWLVEHAHEPEVPDSSVRGVWLHTEQVLVVEFRHGEQAQRVFLSGWMGHCRWAVEQAGHVQIMPPHADPGLPLWNDHVAWAQPWRESILHDVRDTLDPIVVGRWAMLYWASRSPSAFNVLQENARVL